MSFWCLQFPQKNKQNQVDLSRKVEFVRLFFWGNVYLKKSFRLFLTFTHLPSPYICMDLISNEILLYLPSSQHIQKCCVYIYLLHTVFFSDHHQTVQLIKDKRSNSCFSESSEPGSLKNGAEQGRRPSRAFLIKQRDSGEETLVTLTPVGGRQNVPTIVGPQFSKGKDI